MLAHQIFRGADLVFFCVTFLVRLRATQQPSPCQRGSTKDNAALEKNSAVARLFVSMSILHVSAGPLS